MRGLDWVARIGFWKLFAAAVAFSPLAATRATAGEHAPFIPRLTVSSTIPGIGDLNPYGLAFVPEGFPAGGTVKAGDVLVSNFNNNQNQQGIGTTIVKLTPNGTVAPSVPPGQNGNAATFFTSTPTGLSTALGVLRRGFVLVGNVPTTDGTFATIADGSLQVIDLHGNFLKSLIDPNFLDSPWDLTINDEGAKAQVFVSNVLSGTVSRLDLAVSSSNVTVLNKTQIAMGYTHRSDPTALVLGPTGLAYDRKTDVLYVASTADNAIFTVSHAGKATAPVVKGTLFFSDPHLRGPLALAFAPNGNLLTANGDAVNTDPTHPSEIIEFTKSAKFIREFNVDAGTGGAFGIATVLSDEPGFNLVFVDDNANDISVYALPPRDDSNDGGNENEMDR
jgi:hypothetical protein